MSRHSQNPSRIVIALLFAAGAVVAIAGCGGIVESPAAPQRWKLRLATRVDGLPEMPPPPVCPGATMPQETSTVFEPEGENQLGPQQLCGVTRGIRLTGGTLHAMLDETDEVQTASLQILPGWMAGPLVNKRGADGQWRLTGAWLIAEHENLRHGKPPLDPPEPRP